MINSQKDHIFILSKGDHIHVCKDVSKMIKQMESLKTRQSEEPAKDLDNPESERGKRIPLKSIESRKGEINRYLMNQIILNKYIKKIGVGEVHSATERNSLSKETKILSGDTLQNFKALQTTFGDYTPNLIDYDSLYTKLNHIMNAPKENFDFGEDKKKMEDLKNDLKTKEEYFLNKYNRFREEIEKKKQFQVKVRASLSNNITKQKSLQAQVIRPMKYKIYI